MATGGARDGRFGWGLYLVYVCSRKTNFNNDTFPDNKGMLRTSIMHHVGESRSELLHLPLQQLLSATSSRETGGGMKSVLWEDIYGHLQNRKPTSPLQRLADKPQEAPSSPSPESGEEASKVVEHQLDQSCPW